MQTPVPLVADLSLEEKLGQMLMVRYPDRNILADMLARGWAGSFYFGMKGLSAEAVVDELNRLQTLSKLPALVAFGFACCDCGTGLLKGNLMRLGATRSRELAYKLGYIETAEQRGYGFHFPGTPVLDVNTEPRNPIINTRAISDDVDLVCELGLEVLRGVMDARGLTCAMHFPGHGATIHDSHIVMPVDDRPAETIWELDLLPYRRAIERGLINGLCTNHNYYPGLVAGAPRPATICPEIVTDLLRGRMGYEGIITSDSLTMKPMKDAYGIEEAAILTVLAGHDIILQDYQSDPMITHRALVAAVRSGRIPEAQVDASCARVLRLKAWLGLFEERLTDPARISELVATPANKAFAMELARRAVTCLEGAALPLSPADPSRALVIANGSGEAVNIDMDVTHAPAHERLHAAIRRRLPQAPTITLSEKLAPEELAAALQAAREADVIIFGLFTRVLCYNEDSISLAPPYRQLITGVAALGKPTILLGLGNPYIIADLPRAQGTLLTYDEDCPESIEACVEALFGEIVPTGKLPVTIPGYGAGRSS
ncbi:glycoside hydrolase family 3 C-terminal domain-containing protein [bacterium]|nr:glycoside hydrolase family 3 C-terminal domain-containing protein [bacterium]